MSLLKQWIPTWMKQWVRPGSGVVLYRSTNQNIYHCTVQKCASQWVRGIFSDPRVYRYSGLTSYQYQHHLPGKYDPRKLTDRRFNTAFPESTIATPLYIDYEGYTTIPKPAFYKTVFLMRDPRDVLISWYFSIKYSHPAFGEVERIRQDLHRLSESDGLLYALEFLNDYGLFQAQRSWAGATAKDPNVLLVRYEDLIGPDTLPALERLLMHCDIRMPGNVLEELLSLHSFEKLSGRKRGQEDLRAHYRKGIAGDWHNHFNDPIRSQFAAVAGDVLDVWGYE